MAVPDERTNGLTKIEVSIYGGFVGNANNYPDSCKKSNAILPSREGIKVGVAVVVVLLLGSLKETYYGVGKWRK